jgi:putative ABC transport system ATP-binding protein
LDLREIKLESVRKQIAVIGHNEIIEDTILENIRLGRPEITVTQVRSLLSRLRLMSEIAQFPAGLHTQLSPTGSPLSSTQAKHLMIARAVISNPGLLIIDGLLDDWQNFGNSEAKQILFSEDAPWTLLILTSSESIIQLCQRVIYLQPANE